MSTARHHAEWLSLVETSGPFLSMPVLLRAFPQGLDAHDPEYTRDLRLAHEEWEDSQLGGHPDPALHTAWARFVLTRMLEFPDEIVAKGQAIPSTLRVPVPEHGETLSPDLVIRTPDGRDNAGSPRLLIQVYPPDQGLERAVAGRRWKASPQSRMTELLRGLRGQGLHVAVGLVTNGEHWMMVSTAADEAVGYASWYASLWLEEPLTLRAFRSLLGLRRFFGVADSDTLEALLRESASAQEEVTDQLGYQVRRAVEVLVQALDQADKDQQRTLLRDIPERQLYEAAVTIMMRLVFLFAAEERGLLLLGDPLFDQHYAVSTLRAKLRETADLQGEEVLERRFDAWCRLLATFRAVHGGIRHDRFILPAYGGSLFDPDRFPFLEGRKVGTSWMATPAQSVPVSNRTVLHLLEALQMLQVRVPGGGPAEVRRLSFRALDIEQIGHVYEGLLDHTALRASGPVLGLVGARDAEEEVALDELENLRGQGSTCLTEFLEDRTKRSANALNKALTYQPVGEDTTRLLTVCDGDQSLEVRVRPFAGLLREDTRGYPIVITPGSLYVTQGADRRTTGTHYTPRSLTEPLVQHALDPLVYDGPSEGKPREQWTLKPAKELLGLRVCDIAMGSGAFLVQACRYLSARLAEAWEEAERRRRPEAPGITPEGMPSVGDVGERLIPRDAEERLALARRLVTDRCLYGVDKNALAVEMAKLSLWLITLQKDRPFTFLDHALKCGDSLLGVTSSDQVEWLHLDSGPGRQLPLWGEVCATALRTATEKRRRIESFTVQNIRDSEEKARLLAEADQAMEPVRLIADLLIGAALSAAAKPGDALDDTVGGIAARLASAFDESRPLGARARDLEELQQTATALLSGSTSSARRRLHWALEFPEVFGSTDRDKRGFDAVVSNPPFLGGQKITGVLGTDYRNYLVRHIAEDKRGSADLCAYFFLRAYQLLRSSGNLAMLSTNTIWQGDTREVGLEQLLAKGCSIPRAVPSRKWPGSANLEVAHVWVRRGPWAGGYVLGDRLVPGITAFLTSPGTVSGTPYRLTANKGKSFQGSIVLGMGFVLSPEQALELIARNPRNRDVLFPYLNGEDLNSRPDQSPSRWVVNFKDWPLRRGTSGSWQSASAAQRKKWLGEGVVPDDYPAAVAADYPDVLVIVENKVKPERQRRKANGQFALRRPLPERWWHYAEKRPNLYATTAKLNRVLVGVRHTQYWSVAPYRPDLVFSDALVVFALEGDGELAVLESSIHESWARQYSGSLETRLRYSPSDCFDTFPLVASTDSLAAVGQALYQYRRALMVSNSQSLTDVYNRVHDTHDMGEVMRILRDAHVDMDLAVAAAYGWTDLDLGHGFHDTKQGVRFTISEEARQEVLARVLALNHTRYEDEVRRGLHQKMKSKELRNGEEEAAENLFTQEERG
jgi:methylase of polypeptide subunit release factors